RCWMCGASSNEPSAAPPESAAVTAPQAVRDRAATAVVTATRDLRRVREDIVAPWGVRRGPGAAEGGTLLRWPVRGGRLRRLVKRGTCACAARCRPRRRRR